MAAALSLLLFALAFVLYRDRNFWFPDTPQAEGESQNSTVAAATSRAKARNTSSRHNQPQSHKHVLVRTASDMPDTPAAAITRTALPPLEIEVLAGNVRRTVRPGSNSVQVDLEKGSMPRAAAKPTPLDETETAASVTRAAERVEVSADIPNVVTHSVTPGYPMLARQMKVQGSVILQALIGRDGLIQELQVVSGPPILAGAAQEAVKQWHFKPHYQGTETVETQAKITVNFTISTN
jgi:TonB family protein